MFDQKPQHTPGEGSDIDFLHGEDGKAPKQRRITEPPELAHTNDSPRNESVDLKPRVSFFQKIANLFQSKKKDGGAPAPTTTGAGMKGNREFKRKQETLVLKTPRSHPSLRIAAPQQATPLGAEVAVDPFEVKEIKDRGATDAPSGQKLSEPERLSPKVILQSPEVVAPWRVEETGKLGHVQTAHLKNGSLGNLKKIPLSEFVSSSLKGVGGGFGGKGKERADQETALRDDLFDVNLLPTQKKHFSLKAKKMLCLVSVSIEFLVLLLLFVLLQARADGRVLGLRELESKSTLLDIQIKKYKSVVSGATDLQKKVKVLNSLFAEREDVTKALAWLEANTLKTVFYENFSTTADGTFSVGVVANNVTEAAQQLKVFLNAPVWKHIDAKGLLIREDEEGGTLVSYVIEASPTQEFYSSVQK